MNFSRISVFAGRAFTQLPITSDYQSAKMFISSINTDLIGQQGTAIGSAIKMACNSFSDSERTGKSIIIITDAENHEDDAKGAAKEAAEKGMTNLEFVSKSLELRDAIIESGGTDPFLPVGKGIEITRDDYEAAEFTAQ